MLWHGALQGGGRLSQQTLRDVPATQTGIEQLRPAHAEHMPVLSLLTGVLFLKSGAALRCVPAGSGACAALCRAVEQLLVPS